MLGERRGHGRRTYRVKGWVSFGDSTFHATAFGFFVERSYFAIRNAA
jgi:hypothetical protein